MSQRARFTNGQVRVPVMIHGDAHRKDDRDEYALVHNFPCFVARDGRMTVKNASLTPKPLLSSRSGDDRIFYGIACCSTPHGRQNVTRVDVVTRGTYMAPQSWLYTPALWAESRSGTTFDDDYRAYRESMGDDLNDLTVANGNNTLNLEADFFPYLHNCGVIMYNKGENDTKLGYPFCVTRYQSLLMMKYEMNRPGDARQQFVVIGQFFSHVTDWEEAHDTGKGKITEKMHEARCRNRLVSMRQNGMKEKRRAKRKFLAYLRT